MKIATTQHQGTTTKGVENGILLKDMHPEEAPETQERDQGKHVKTNKPAHAEMPEIAQEQTHVTPIQKIFDTISKIESIGWSISSCPE